MTPALRYCAWPKCRKSFIPIRRGQLYHDKKCRGAASQAKLRERAFEMTKLRKREARQKGKTK